MQGTRSAWEGIQADHTWPVLGQVLADICANPLDLGRIVKVAFDLHPRASLAGRLVWGFQ